MDESLYRQTASRKRTSARSTSLNDGDSASCRAFVSTATPWRTSPSDMRAQPSASAARYSSSGSARPGRAARTSSSSATTCWNSFDSFAASAREMTLSTRARVLEETPVSRKLESTASRAASHSTVSPVGRVLPRSIWLTYSFEKRSPASSVCVRPWEMRSWRTRSPSVWRAAPGEEAVVSVVSMASFTVNYTAKKLLHNPT
jgi:hypothetical protein